MAPEGNAFALLNDVETDDLSKIVATVAAKFDASARLSAAAKDDDEKEMNEKQRLRRRPNSSGSSQSGSGRRKGGQFGDSKRYNSGNDVEQFGNSHSNVYQHYGHNNDGYVHNYPLGGNGNGYRRQGNNNYNNGSARSNSQGNGNRRQGNNNYNSCYVRNNSQGNGYHRQGNCVQNDNGQANSYTNSGGGGWVHKSRRRNSNSQRVENGNSGEYCGSQPNNEDNSGKDGWVHTSRRRNSNSRLVENGNSGDYYAYGSQPNYEGDLQEQGSHHTGEGRNEEVNEVVEKGSETKVVDAADIENLVQNGGDDNSSVMVQGQVNYFC